MKWLRRKPAYSQAEISQQVHDITLLQAQREAARDTDEIARADALVEMAQKMLERMYEANEGK